jgi:hypothetical protein
MASVASSEDLNQTLIWKGITHPGNHGINNRMLNQGNTSSYAVSYSGLISAILARTDRRPLHYVLLASTPSELFSNFAMAEDAAIPICIPDSTQLTGLTSRHADEPTDATVVGEIDETVRRLSMDVLAKRAKLASSKTIASSFASSLEGARYVYGSELNKDPLLLYLHKRYFMEALQSFRVLKTQPWITTRAGLVSYTGSSSWNYGHIISGLSDASYYYSELPTFDSFQASLSSYVTPRSPVSSDPLRDITLDPPSVASPSLLAAGKVSLAAVVLIRRLRSQAWFYAFADFLIRKNLSAVVDIPAWSGMLDAHGGSLGCYLDDFLNQQFTQGLYFAMIRSLKSVALDTGGTLLDITTLSLHSEFDRLPFHESKGFGDGSKNLQIGTNHSNTASVLLAGYGINRGRVVGGVHEGPNMTDLFPGRNYLDPLPVNLSTGRPDAGGQVPNILSLCPTLVAVFGGSLPPQQTTDYGAIPAILKT